MAKYGSASAVFLVSGYNLLAAKLKGLTFKVESITEQSDGLGDNYEAHSPVGKTKATLTQSGGFWSTAALGIHAMMAAGTPTTPQTAARVGVLGYMGHVMGAAFVGLSGLFETAYDVQVEDSKLTKANVTHLISGAVERGQIVQPLATKTADWNTKTLGTTVDYTTDPSQRTIPITSNSVANPSVVTCPVAHGLTTNDLILIAGVSTSNPTINGARAVTVISDTTFSVPVNVGTGGTGGTFVRANSSGGGAGYQQVTALSGFSGFIGKIRDSADDTTYADLVDFANVTAAPDAQRVAVAGTIDRYLSFDGNVTGSGSIDVFAGFARN
jgi:hypothetical protein